MEKILGSIGLIAISVAIVVIAFLSLGRVDQWLKNMAIADCAELGTFTTVNQGASGDGQTFTTTSTEPIRTVYKTCIEDKGYSTDMK
ncbi:hypothetical protein IPM65_04075 [Candidatus Roizmanbacteria bacterium]|nr:MAG: hypothetical protein IPM65_04075 [Candidatus Roizmanbacteria bacterium]